MCEAPQRAKISALYYLASLRDSIPNKSNADIFFCKTEQIGQRAPFSMRRDAQFVKRGGGAVDPECGVTKPGGTAYIPAIAGDKQNFFSRQAKYIRPQLICFRRSLEFFDCIDRQNMIEHALHPRCLDHRIEHLWIAVGQDRKFQTHFLELLQHA